MSAFADQRSAPAEMCAFSSGRLNEYGPIERVVMCGPREAYGGQQRLDERWLTEQFAGRPDYCRALEEYAALHAAVAARGPRIEMLGADPRAGISAIYSRDSSIVCRCGVILGRMRTAHRRPEPGIMRDYYASIGVPVVGAIEPPGLLEGGDLVWLDEETCAVGQGFRTNAAGISQLQSLLGDEVHVEVMALPFHHGPDACLHLMSLLSPLDADLALVHSPQLTVGFRQWLLDRGMELVEVAEAEYEPGMGCNVLALAPRVCLAIDGNPVTRARLEAAGCEVASYPGAEISLKGGGGPTCLTRPLLRG